MRLFIAEKPSVAKAIAAELGVTSRKDGYLVCGEDQVTWCFGHMLAQAEPDEYLADAVPLRDGDRKVWRIEDLPIIPDKWILQPKDEVKKQLQIIGRLLRSAAQIVNAGDPDREGQLLVDELLAYFNNRQPVLRYWSNAIDPISVQRALTSMRDNRTFYGLAEAAEGRSKADWLIGMNLSRAYTLRAQRGGSRALLTVGRVQTPTLALVVARDREIEAFKAVPFHTIRADIQHPAGVFQAVWKTGEDQSGLDSDGRLTDTVVANALIEALSGQSGSVSQYQQEARQQKHPLTFSLSGLTALASKRFGYSAEDVLKTCQSLYEVHKLTTYPRTDCAYLPESQFADAPEVLAAIKAINPGLAAIVDGADLDIRSRTWNDQKVSAHHGMIPTMHRGDLSQLNDKERHIYDLIVRAYLAQFYPIHEFMHTTVVVEIGGELFSARGSVVTRSGWHDVYLDDDDNDQDDKSQALPVMSEGDAIICQQVVRKDTMTKPPARFTEGTLITAMVNIHRFVTDPQHKKLLREGDGIGTEATRAAIISELKRRHYLELKGKQIVSTQLGRSVTDVFPEVVKSPVLTALYERMLRSVESGKTDLADFMARQESFIRDQVAKANDGSVAIAGDKDAILVSEVFKCLVCGTGLSRRASSGKKGYWWGCAGFPSCKQAYPDVKGRPNYNKGHHKADKELHR